MSKVATYIGGSDQMERWCGCDSPRRSGLYVGWTYEVESVATYAWHQAVTIKGRAGRFNAACFELKDSEDMATPTVCIDPMQHQGVALETREDGA